MPLTALGKELRKFRVDHELTLTEMATRAELSTALVSSVETGRKPATRQFVDKLVHAYPALLPKQALLHRLAQATQREIRIRLGSDTRANDVLIRFAQAFPGLNPSQLDAMSSVLGVCSQS